MNSKTILASLFLTLAVASSAFAQTQKPISNEAEGMCWPGQLRCSSSPRL